jgi:hypothetical protein
LPTGAARWSLAVVLLCLTPLVSAQETTSGTSGKSVALAKQLTAALDAAKLDSIAAKDPAAPDIFVAALYFPGAQLLVVSAKYVAPQLLETRIAKKEYRDTYIDLSSASVPESKIFVQDGGADGIRAKREENQAFDIYEAGGKSTIFDGDWKKQKLSEQDYMKVFTAADDRYSAMLTALIAQLKKTS